MNWHLNHKVDSFCVVGISYQKANTAIRSLFSLNDYAAESLLKMAKDRGIHSIVVLNTCNRVEVYSFSNDIYALIALLLHHCPEASLDLFNTYGYKYTGSEALQHVFRVGAGIESQILGDYQIAGQLKEAISRSAAVHAMCPVMHRLMANVLQASKKIKNHTALSKGTASVSFALVEWIKQQVYPEATKVLVIGAGSFGKIILKNLKDYFPEFTISVTNRTMEKARHLGASFNVNVVPYEALKDVANQYNIIICCTNAAQPIVHKTFFTSVKSACIFDLSVPSNVSADVLDIQHIRLITVDDISRSISRTMALRSGEVQKAMPIIAQYLELFLNWLDHYRHTPLVSGFRHALVSITNHGGFVWKKNQDQPLNFDTCMDSLINETTSHLMQRIKTEKDKGCQMIDAYHRFITTQLSAACHD